MYLIRRIIIFHQILTIIQKLKICKMEKPIFNYNLEQRTNSPLNVDCIKVCPFNKTLFAFAYYQQGQLFQGGISLQNFASNQLKINKFDILQCGPVLHICWLDRLIDNKYILIGASRSQKIFIFSVDPNNITKEVHSDKNWLQLEKQIHIQKNVFCLYVDALSSKDPLHRENIDVIVSTNQSQVFHLQIDEQLNLIQTLKYSKHEYAVWTCRFNQHAQQRQFMCGDEVNSIYYYNKDGQKVSKNSKAHDQGICDIVFTQKQVMYTGGFDGYVNKINLKEFQKSTFTYKLGGTIWRIVPDQTAQNLLICNSSQKIFQIIDQKTGKQVWNSKHQHTSLAYAADWSGDILLTASFYDQIVCVWKKQN